MPPKGDALLAPVRGRFQLTMPARLCRQEAVVKRPVVAQHAGRQAEAGCVRLGNGGVEVGDADHLQQRPEMLLVLSPLTGVTSIRPGVTNGRPASGRRISTIGSARSFKQPQLRVDQSVGRGIGNDGPHEGRGIAS